MTTKRYNIPIGWTIKKLEDCFYFLKTSNYSRAETCTDSDVYYIHYGDIHCKYHRYVQPNDIITFISKQQAIKYDRLQNGDLILLDASEDYDGTTKCIELINIVNEHIISGLHTIVLRDKENNFANLFKAYLTSIPYVKDEFVKQVTGIKVYGISKGNLAKINLVIPPLKEQERIAEVLSCWDDGIEQLQKIISLKEQQKQGLMQRLLTGKTRLPGFTQPWKEVELYKVGKIITGSTPPMVDQENYCGNFPWVTAQDLKGKYVYNSKIKLTLKGKKLSRIIPAGSVLVTCIASIGLNAIAKIDMATNQQINAIIPNQLFSNEFLYYIISYNTEYLKKFAGSGGILILSKKEFEKIKFFFPILYEQRQIAAILSEADNEIDLLKRKLGLFKQQKQWLMQQLLTGKRRLAC